MNSKGECSGNHSGIKNRKPYRALINSVPPRREAVNLEQRRQNSEYSRCRKKLNARKFCGVCFVHIPVHRNYSGRIHNGANKHKQIAEHNIKISVNAKKIQTENGYAHPQPNICSYFLIKKQTNQRNKNNIARSQKSRLAR